MSAMHSPDAIRSIRKAMAEPAHADRSVAARWELLHETGREIASMAALAAEPMREPFASYPERIEAAGATRLALAHRGLDDIDAMMQPGLTALRLIAARGLDTTAPALALWREFYHARAGLLALCPPELAEHLPA